MENISFFINWYIFAGEVFRNAVNETYVLTSVFFLHLKPWCSIDK